MRFLLSIVLFVVLFLSSLNALNNSVLSGFVVDGLTHEPIENAVVQLVDLNLFDATDSTGAFSFSGIDPGRYILRISMLGYRPKEEVIAFQSGTRSRIYIHLFQVPIQTSTIVVTGEHPTLILDEVYELSALRGKELQRDMGLTLASTLKNETGISMRSMGPAPSRPVIRGMGGHRIIINEDGTETRDLSATSPDHALTVESFTSERIEVIRGPKILLNSPSTTGGIINIIKDDIPLPGAENISGSIGILGESANSGYLGSTVLNIPLQSFQLRGEITRKKAGNLDTPAGLLKNSEFSNLSYSTGGSYNFDKGSAGLAYREYESDYGIPGGFTGAHPDGVNISMTRRQIKGLAKMNLNSAFMQETDLHFSRTYYRHREFEKSGLIGAEFTTYNYDVSLNTTHKNLLFFNDGIAGITGVYRDFKVGGFVFTPPSTSSAISSYLFESFSGGDLEFQIGFRYDHARITPNRNIPDSRIGNIRERTFNTFSFSTAVFYEFFPGVFAGTNISKSSRIPDIEELYSEGPHLAAYSYETGNPDLSAESGYGTELLLYLKNHKISMMFTLFRYDFNYFILPRNTGRTNFATLLPIYTSSGVKALLSGFENEFHLHIGNNFEATASISYTHGLNKTTDQPLAAIPPLKSLAEFRYIFHNLTGGISLEGALSQKRVDEFELPTASYFISGLFVQYVYTIGNTVHNFSISADNIFNREYRNHLSRTKAIIPESGRNIRGTYRFYF
jgi:iron complex outermembrane recepter protein